MIVYNGIYIIERDNGHVRAHMKALRATKMEMQHCLYYSQDCHAPAQWHMEFPAGQEHKAWVHHVRCAASRDNMPLKTYGMLRHALTVPDWTHFFKTDANVIIHSIDWETVKGSEYAGLLVGPRNVKPSGGREYKNGEREPLLREPYLGKMPLYWCGGSGYIVSRRLAQLVVDRGAWAARGHFAEDAMVAVVAEENGIMPVAAVSYGDHKGFTAL